MSAQVINGAELAAGIRADAQQRVAAMAAQGWSVRLDAVMVGNPADAALYARWQEKRCAKVGIAYRLHTLAEDFDNDALQSFIDGLSRDPDVTGVMLNLPLPDHLDVPAAQYAIDPYKDVEGVNPANIGLLFYGTPIIAPCTARAVMAILETAGVDVKGRDVCVVGQGSIVGKPIALALMGAEATVRTCNKYTTDLAAHTADAGVLIAAAGVPGLIGREHVKPGAVVIDVGINTVPDPQSDDPAATRVVGDVRFDEVVERAGHITPVPGGVGPVTVAILLQNAAEAAAKQHTARRIHPH